MSASKSSRPVLVILIHPNTDYAGMNILLTIKSHYANDVLRRTKAEFGPISRTSGSWENDSFARGLAPTCRGAVPKESGCRRHIE